MVGKNDEAKLEGTFQARPENGVEVSIGMSSSRTITKLLLPICKQARIFWNNSIINHMKMARTPNILLMTNLQQLLSENTKKKNKGNVNGAHAHLNKGYLSCIAPGDLVSCLKTWLEVCKSIHDLLMKAYQKPNLATVPVARTHMVQDIKKKKFGPFCLWGDPTMPLSLFISSMAKGQFEV